MTHIVETRCVEFLIPANAGETLALARFFRHLCPEIRANASVLTGNIIENVVVSK